MHQNFFLLLTSIPLYRQPTCYLSSIHLMDEWIWVVYTFGLLRTFVSRFLWGHMVSFLSHFLPWSTITGSYTDLYLTIWTAIRLSSEVAMPCYIPLQYLAIRIDCFYYSHPSRLCSGTSLWFRFHFSTASDAVPISGADLSLGNCLFSSFTSAATGLFVFFLLSYAECLNIVNIVC